MDFARYRDFLVTVLVLHNGADIIDYFVLGQFRYRPVITLVSTTILIGAVYLIGWFYDLARPRSDDGRRP